MAVRASATSAASSILVQQRQVNFVKHIFQQLDQWANLFFSSAWEAPLSMARDAGADILAAFKLAGAVL
jgi:hypothetical protein